MKTAVKKTLAWSCALSAVLSLGACDGSSGEAMELVDVGDVAMQNDPADTEDHEMQCEPDFDTAELLFTEIDRQWSCTVDSDGAEIADALYFQRDGTATFNRLGQVYWNRNLPAQEVRLASPLLSTSVLRNITSSNTVLQFDLSTGGSTDDFYDCVLSPRQMSDV